MRIGNRFSKDKANCSLMRTTHFSGTLTDLGIFLGHRLRGLPVDRRRIRLLIALVIAFLVGAVAGTWLFGAFSFRALYVPALLTGTTGAGYGLYRHFEMRHQS